MRAWNKGLKGFCQGEKNGTWKGGRIKHTAGYILVLSPNHPEASKQKYVYEHRLVMEEHLGRYLNENERIIHLNGLVDDNRIDNLKLITCGGPHHSSHGYVRIRNRGHPAADTTGRVYEHRLVMERHLGRYLYEGETITHINGIKDDNRIENLRLFASPAEASKGRPSANKGKHLTTEQIDDYSRRQFYSRKVLPWYKYLPKCRTTQNENAKTCRALAVLWRGVKIPCVCGCKGVVDMYDNDGKRLSFLPHHVSVNRSLPHWTDQRLITCTCGCGEKLLKYDKRGRTRTSIPGHLWQDALVAGQMHSKLLVPNSGVSMLPQTRERIAFKRARMKLERYHQEHNLPIVCLAENDDCKKTVKSRKPRRTPLVWVFHKDHNIFNLSLDNLFFLCPIHHTAARKIHPPEDFDIETVREIADWQFRYIDRRNRWRSILKKKLYHEYRERIVRLPGL